MKVDVIPDDVILKMIDEQDRVQKADAKRVQQLRVWTWKTIGENAESVNLEALREQKLQRVSKKPLGKAW